MGLLLHRLLSGEAREGKLVLLLLLPIAVVVDVIVDVLIVVVLAVRVVGIGVDGSAVAEILYLQFREAGGGFLDGALGFRHLFRVERERKGKGGTKRVKCIEFESHAIRSACTNACIFMSSTFISHFRQVRPFDLTLTQIDIPSFEYYPFHDSLHAAKTYLLRQIHPSRTLRETPPRDLRNHTFL